MFVVDMWWLYVCLVLVCRFVDYTVGYCCFDFGMEGSYSYFVCKMGVGVGYWDVVGFEMAVLV